MLGERTVYQIHEQIRADIVNFLMVYRQYLKLEKHMKITDNSMYQTHELTGREQKAAMEEVGHCVGQAIQDCYKQKDLTALAYKKNIRNHLSRASHKLTVRDVDVKVELVDQYGDPWIERKPPDFNALRATLRQLDEREKEMENVALSICTKNKHKMPHNTRLMMIQSKAVGYQSLLPTPEELEEKPDFWQFEPEKEPPPVVRPKMSEGERNIFSPQNIWGEGWKVPEPGDPEFIGPLLPKDQEKLDKEFLRQKIDKLKKFIAKEFDISLKSARIIAEAMQKSEEHYKNYGRLEDLSRQANTPGLEEYVQNTSPELDIQTNVTAKNFAALCVEYGGDFQWGLTAGVPEAVDAIKYFQKIGMTTEEIKDMLLVINMQRRAVGTKEFEEDLAKLQEIAKKCGFTITRKEAEKYANPNPDGKNDLAHMMVASASLANQRSDSHRGLNVGLGWLGKAGGHSELSSLSHIKGDIYSAAEVGFEKALPYADYTSDLDAVNIYNRVMNDRISYHEAMIDYYADLEKRVKNREREFIENYEKGTLEENFERFKKDVNKWSPGVEYIRTRGESKNEGKSSDVEVEKAKKWVFDRIKKNMYK
ncbi:MAG: hypothetical protein FWH04_00120 [Oscillospiraceae bacterium]|nr:hypothetical protein [Oscillospiraceae bacterium]